MKPISDKEFDTLFHEKFKLWEVEPEEIVWDNIAGQLEKKKRPFPVLWMAAASLAGVIMVGLWYSSTIEPMKLTGAVEKNTPVEKTRVIAAKVKEINNDQPVKQVIQEKGPVSKTIEDRDLKQANQSIRGRNVNASSIATVKVERKVEGNKVEENSRIASVEQPASSSQLVASTNSDPELLTEDGESIKNLRVSKSVVSSVVNFVIGKVDKRKDKLIEFEDNDEGTKVKSMNLILVKFKAKN